MHLRDELFDQMIDDICSEIKGLFMDVSTGKPTEHFDSETELDEVIDAVEKIIRDNLKVYS